jgi:hypothetical protein
MAAGCGLAPVRRQNDRVTHFAGTNADGLRRAPVVAVAGAGERMSEPQLIPVFIPALVVLLHHAERRKGVR